MTWFMWMLIGLFIGALLMLPIISMSLSQSRPVETTAGQKGKSGIERMTELEKIAEMGLISKEEYETKRAEILADL